MVVPLCSSKVNVLVAVKPRTVEAQTTRFVGSASITLTEKETETPAIRSLKDSCPPARHGPPATPQTPRHTRLQAGQRSMSLKASQVGCRGAWINILELNSKEKGHFRSCRAFTVGALLICKLPVLPRHSVWGSAFKFSLVRWIELGGCIKFASSDRWC